MSGFARAAWRAGALAVACLSLGVASARAAPLRFEITEGRTVNGFFRDGPVAAHVVLTSGNAPRVIVAFPAGNTGAALWFEATETPVSLQLAPGSSLQGVERPDGRRGIVARLRADAPRLTVRATLLAGIRSLRDYIAAGRREVPPQLASRIEAGPPVVFHRPTVDGLHHVELRLAGEAGTTVRAGPQAIEIEAGPAGRIELEITALTDETPLTPFAPGDLFKPGAADRPLDRQVFAFLASAEKLNAGSWRFLTYFGRDTLMTVQLLLPVLQPPAIEGALGSVLDRLGPDGEVAHEEAIGEYAALENLTRRPPPAELRAPALDYKMVDGDFMLAPAVASYLLDTPEGPARAAAFLARTTPAGESYAAALRRNLARVCALTAPFAERRDAARLVSLKPGVPVGNWRDSEDGLGGGRYPFDVNVALAPAALQAAARLARSGWLGAEPALADRAGHLASQWTGIEEFFRVEVPAAGARQLVTAYARSLQLDAEPAVASLDGAVRYHALALDADGQPVPVMHTDAGFVLFFTAPSAAYLDGVAGEILRPFPAGLRLPVGLAVSNPVFGGEAWWRRFTPGDYHGPGVWSWQQALMAAGLQRQLARADLPAATRARLAAAQRALWDAIAAMQAQSAGELWSWEARSGRAVLVPFGQDRSHVDESNAAQLWSTVYLAVRPPAAAP